MWSQKVRKTWASRSDERPRGERRREGGRRGGRRRKRERYSTERGNHQTLWSRTTRNQDIRTGPLAHPSVCPFASTTHLFAFSMLRTLLTCSAALTHSLVGHLWDSEWYMLVNEAVLDHSAKERQTQIEAQERNGIEEERLHSSRNGKVFKEMGRKREYVGCFRKWGERGKDSVIQEMGRKRDNVGWSRELGEKMER